MRLNSARIRASEFAVHVTRSNPAVDVAGVTLLRSRQRSALVVRLRNLARIPLSDLPISVGVVTAQGRKLDLNGAPGVDYFQTHIPAIAPRGLLTWVFMTARRLPGAAHAFAEVGLPGSPPLSSPRALPQIAVTNLTPAPVVGGAQDFRLAVRNLSSVPQYELQVYAVAERFGRYVAAGRATIADLSTGATTVLRMRLLGNPTHATLALQAPPTIFG